MLRITLNVVVTCLVGAVLFVAALMFAFFASPEAVRTSPPALYDSLLLQQFSNG